MIKWDCHVCHDERTPHKDRQGNPICLTCAMENRVELGFMTPLAADYSIRKRKPGSSIWMYHHHKNGGVMYFDNLNRCINYAVALAKRDMTCTEVMLTLNRQQEDWLPCVYLPDGRTLALDGRPIEDKR